MAISQTYCDFATGNDYKGATFTDGAYTSATKTLVKAGAFAATKVNHWLWLESNDGGSIVAGYYKVATVPDANTVTLATDAGAGVDDDAAKCVQHDGTISLPWRSVQGALDLITRDATNGDQVNIKAGEAQVLSAPLALSTYGATSSAAPLIIRGYTSAANDGGVGEIDGGGNTLWAGTEEFKGLVDLDLHTLGTGIAIAMQRGHFIVHCAVHKGGSAPNNKALITVGESCLVQGCHIYDIGTGTIAATAIYGNGKSGVAVLGNYIVTSNYGIQQQVGNGWSIAGNIILCEATGAIGVRLVTPGLWAPGTCVLGNILYNTTAGTASGIDSQNKYGATIVANNVVVGWSGTGGAGIRVTTGRANVLGYNAFYNNTEAYKSGTVGLVDMTDNDVALAADPFTDAENGDFSLTTAGKAALRGQGWPGAYLGANAATDGHVTIGAIQYGEAEAGGGGGRRPWLRMHGG